MPTEFLKALASLLICFGLPCQGRLPHEGYDSARIMVAGVPSTLILEGASLRWLDLRPTASAGDFAQVTLPWDVAGSVTLVGADRALVSGRQSQTNNGVIARITFAENGQIGSMQVVDHVVIPALDPHWMQHSAFDSVVYILDSSARKLHYLEWPAWQAVGTPALAADFTAYNRPPYSLRKPDTTEPPAGVILESGDGPAFARFERYRVFRQSGNWVVENVTPANPPAVTGGISIESPRLVHVDGPLRLKCLTGGSVSVERLTDGATVASGVLAASSGWQDFVVAQGALQVGESYRVIGAGLTPCTVFYPGWRFGSPSVVGNMTTDPGYLRPHLMRVNNPRFMVWGRATWDPAATIAPPGVDIPYVLAAMVGEPGPSSTVTLPGGQVTLSSLDLVLAGEGWTPFDLNTRDYQLQAKLPIPDDDTLQGLAILFQWGVFDAQGSLILSDVFGYRVLPRTTASGTAAGAASTPSTPAVRLAAGRAWMVQHTQSDAEKMLRKGLKKLQHP